MKKKKIKQLNMLSQNKWRMKGKRKIKEKDQKH